jgi:hypothetical protein
LNDVAEIRDKRSEIRSGGVLDLSRMKKVFRTVSRGDAEDAEFLSLCGLRVSA